MQIYSVITISYKKCILCQNLLLHLPHSCLGGFFLFLFNTNQQERSDSLVSLAVKSREQLPSPYPSSPIPAAGSILFLSMLEPVPAQ